MGPPTASVRHRTLARVRHRTLARTTVTCATSSKNENACPRLHPRLSLSMSAASL
jgi:hypothetical protein